MRPVPKTAALILLAALLAACGARDDPDTPPGGISVSGESRIRVTGSY